MRITNTTREALSFIIRGSPQNGHPPTASVGPGETADLDIVENAPFRGCVLSGSITVADQAAQKRTAHAAAAPTASKKRRR